MKKQVKWLAWLVVIGLLMALVVMWPVGIGYMYKGDHPTAGNIFEAITALVAMIAIVVAIYQIRASNNSQKLVTAADIYKGYLTLAIEHPDESRHNRKGEDGTNREKYDAFITYLLFAAEEILNLFPEDRAWRHALKLDLAHHRDFLQSQAYWDDANSYTEVLQALVTEMLKGEMI